MSASTQMRIFGVALFPATALLARCATPGGDKGVKVTLSGDPAKSAGLNVGKG
jgi:hypothetical protein